MGGILFISVMEKKVKRYFFSFIKEIVIKEKYNLGYLGCIENNTFNTKFSVWDNGMSKKELYYMPNGACCERKLLVCFFSFIILFFCFLNFSFSYF